MMNRLVPITLLASITGLAGSIGAGCGSSSAGSPQSQGDDAGVAEASTSTDTGTGVDVVEAAAYPALLPTDIPQVTSRGGSVMAQPKVYPIYFASDDTATTAQVTDFLSKLGGTQYWKAISTEYGVGALTSGAPIQLLAADNPPATFDDSQIAALLAAKLNVNDPAFPAPDANTIYAFFFPPTVTVTQSGQGQDGGLVVSAKSCVDFGGYHSLTTLNNNTNVAYAVVPECANFNGGGIDAITSGTSHELIETATDPYPFGATAAFSGVDSAHRYWSTVLGGGEVGDMCAQNSGSFVKFPELSAYLVQRSWSNKAALTGLDPCVPVPAGEIYFNTIPNMPDTLMLSGGRPAPDAGTAPDGGPLGIPTKGVKIAVGASRTIELDLFSTAPTSQDWTLEAFDSSALTGGSPQLQFSFDKPRGHNGDKINMTIKVLAAGRRNSEAFLLVSNMGSSATSPQAMWAGVVGN